MFKIMNSSPNMQSLHAAHDKAAHPINPTEKPQTSKWMCLHEAASRWAIKHIKRCSGSLLEKSNQNCNGVSPSHLTEYPSSKRSTKESLTLQRLIAAEGEGT